MKDQNSRELDAILAEYSALRQEIVQRISNRAQLLVASLTVSGVITGLALERRSAALLLVTPLVACLFGIQVLFETIEVFQMGDYIRESIEPTLRTTHRQFVGWEAASYRLRGNLLSHFPAVLSTLVPSVIAVLLGWSYHGPLLTKAALSTLDFLAVLYFLFEYYRHVMRSVERPPGHSPNVKHC